MRKVTISEPATVGPLEQRVLSASVNGTSDDAINAIAGLARVLDDVADEIENHLSSGAREDETAILRGVLRRLRLSPDADVTK